MGKFLRIIKIEANKKTVFKLYMRSLDHPPTQWILNP
jgi:hypothetical protein